MPATNIWNTPGNWLPANVPDMAGETAIFTNSTVTNPTIVAPITIDGITFNGATAFTIDNQDVTTIVGPGLVNTSGLTQTINNSLPIISDLTFTNAATIGTSIVINNSSFVTFDDTSSAGLGTLTNTPDGVINFIGNANGGNATLNNAGSGVADGSTILFSNTASAGSATISNTGMNSRLFFTGSSQGGTAVITNNAAGATTQFSVNANAGNAAIINLAADTLTTFTANASAGTADIVSSGAFTTVSFNDNSTGGTSTITLNGNLAIADFQDNSTAGGATITLNNATALLNFFDTANAGTATINNQGSGGLFPASVVAFFNNSSALNAVITNSGQNSQTLFSGATTAGAATILNSGDDSNTTFVANASAGNANLSNTGVGSSTIFGQNASASGSTILSSGDFSNVRFIGTSTGGASTITLSGNTAIGDFLDNSTAGNATINLTSATALLNFFDSANGGNATINNQGSGGLFPASVVAFYNASSALNAFITNSGQNAQTLFSGTATAGAATILNSGDDSNATFVVNATAGTANLSNSGFGSSTIFGQNTSAGAATIVSGGDFSNVRFLDNSTAGASNITLNGNTAIGDFLDNSTAGNSTITLSSPTALLNFFDTTTAGTATIRNQGSGAAPSSVVAFFNASSAQNSVITNSGNNSQTLFSGTSNAGNVRVTNSGAGTATVFATNAQGGSAVLINANPTSRIDISSLLSSSLTIGSFEGNGTLFLGSQRLTAGGNNRDITFSGLIRDGGFSGGTGGALVKVGTGTWTLSGANTFTGGTDLRLGTIVVANPQALGAGNFQLSDGVLRVGGGTGDIRVGGNYTQTGGELQLRIGGGGPGQFDRLAVVGSANLGGRLRLDSINGYTLQDGDRIAVVTAGGGVNGTFQDVQTAAPLVQGQLQYLSNEVVLSLVRTAFADIAKTPNQRSVAKALDQVVQGPDAADLLAFLDALPIESLPAALDRLAPEELGAIFSISRSAANTQAFTVLHRLDEIRAASRDESLEPVLGGPAKEMKEIFPVEAPRGGVYAQGSGEFVNVGNTTNARGYDFDSGGVTIGADYKVTHNFVTGVLVNYTRATADLTNSGRIEADSIRGGIYASVFGAGGYLSAYVGGGYNSYDTKRNGLQGKAKGSPDGGEFNALIATGYDAHVGALTVGPIAYWQYTYTEVDAFRERGSLAPLNVRSQNSQSSRTNVGIRLAYEVPVGGAILTPEVRATWQHEFGDRSFATTSQFGFGGPDFSVHSSEIGRDSLALNVGLNLQLSPTFGAHAYYLGEFGTSNYDSHNVFVGARMSF